MSMQFIHGVMIALVLLVSGCNQQTQTSEVAFKRTSSAVVIRMEGEADRLNPYLTTTNYGRMVVENIFMYLLAYDPETLSLQPDLAVQRPTFQNITSGPLAGGIAYSFEILPEAVWENGTPVTGYDYLFSMKAALNPLVQAAPLRAYLADVADVVVDSQNPKKFTVTLYQKTYLGEETAGGLLAVLPEYAYDPKGLLKEVSVKDLLDADKAAQLAESNVKLKEFAEGFNSDAYSRDPSKITGCGPYKLTVWEADQRIVLASAEPAST